MTQHLTFAKPATLTGGTGIRLASEESQERPPRRIVGLRISALAETVVLLGIALLIDSFLFRGDRFNTVSPHPFWIIVLLIAAQYGTSEALVAAILASAALLVNNLPEQAFNEDLYTWLLRISYNPILWCIAAVTLGEIRAGQRRKAEALRQQLDAVQEQAVAFADAYERQTHIKTTLEVLVAGQQRTVRTLHAAARAIERQSTTEVLAGIPVLVRSVIGPEKFSFFLLNGSVLELADNIGWSAEERFRRAFSATSPIYTSVVGERQILTASDPAHESILAREGLLAGPLFSEEAGKVIGMLKIEALPFHEFTPATLHHFQILCDWIGSAYAKAQRFERLRGAHKPPSPVEIG